jgi:hypothetical protein
MKTQISRDGFRPEQRYSGVYQQQGRMLTDRDWNEMVDVLKTRIDDGLADALGTGLPRGGALRVLGQPAGAPLFAPGRVWAGGVAGQVASANGGPAPFGYGQQADFPSPPALPTGQPYVLYADLWERPVLALEEDDLRDPALTGPYDTSTRRRTLAQVKWAPAGRDPENPAHNPPRGNALLSLRVPANAPAASGDFLFRVEIHKITWPAGAAPEAPSSIVVKWSRENGARHFRYTEAPPSFLTGKGAWEVWKPVAETHLGYAFGSWAPERGVLSAQAATLSGDAGSFIRRWDGYCLLNQANGVWSKPAEGSADDPRKTAPEAQVEIENGALVVTLGDRTLKLSLDLQGRTFLAGDAWTVPVRRAVHIPDTPVLTAAPPAGVTHRYVTLAAVSAGGEVSVAQKRASFPTVGRLAAGDVDYDGGGSQNSLFDATHDTVGEALDRLWQLGAEHLAFHPAGASAGPSMYQGKTIANARQALDLLADVHAPSLIYEGRPATPDVQSAVTALFARTARPSAWTTVGRTGQFPTLIAAIRRRLDEGARDIRLWLLPGDHPLTPDNVPQRSTDSSIDPSTDITGGPQPMHLTLAGAGRETRLLLPQPVTIRDFASVTFRGLAIESADAVSLTVSGGEVSFLDNRISGFSKEGLVRISGAARVLFRDNVVETTTEGPAAGLFLILEDPCPARLEGNRISGTVSLYGQPGDDLSPLDFDGIRSRLSSVTFDRAATHDLLARNNRLSGFQIAGARIADIRGKSALAPLFRRAVLTNNTIDRGGNQLLAGAVSLHGNLLPAGNIGWVMGEQLVFTGNTAPAPASLELLSLATAAAGQSSRIILRTGGAPAPTS